MKSEVRSQKSEVRSHSPRNRNGHSAPVANRSVTGGGISLGQRVTRANRWREQYNPLRGLSITRAVSLLEQYQRGEMADLQWAYFFIEQTDADLYSLCDRRLSALTQLDWNIKQVGATATGFDEALAGEQAAALREAYEKIDNLYEGIEHLGTATFRGFAHLEKHHDDSGAVTHLEPLDQWNAIRDGLRGPWKYNPDSRTTTFAGLPAENLLDPDGWLVRDTARHINRIGLVKFIRHNLSQKDWDAFIEIYGIPGVIITAPQGVGEGDKAAFEASANATAEGGSGVLPFGSAVHMSDGPRGVNPFRDHLRFLQEQLVLAGTGGLLTMLTQSGSGTLAGGAHQDTFEIIARGEARRIGEIFQRHLDREILRQNFAGQPRLAYFELAANEEQDSKDIIAEIAQLSAAGFQVSAEQASEKTGYDLTLKPAAIGGFGAPDGNPFAKFGNRATPAPAGAEEFFKAAAADLQPLRQRFERLLQIDDPELLRNKLTEFRAELPRLLKNINADPAGARALEGALVVALLNGIEESGDRGQESEKKNPSSKNQAPNSKPEGANE